MEILSAHARCVCGEQCAPLLKHEGGERRLQAGRKIGGGFECGLLQQRQFEPSWLWCSTLSTRLTTLHLQLPRAGAAHLHCNSASFHGLLQVFGSMQGLAIWFLSRRSVCLTIFCTACGFTIRAQENEGREIRTPNLLIWSQTRCRCAIAPC